jgi:arabinofuranosyltransferase
MQRDGSRRRRLLSGNSGEGGAVRAVAPGESGAVRAVAACAAGVFLLYVWSAWLGAGLVDDAFIFFRYAENIAGGRGAVFNAGERVEGFSSAGWTLLLAAAASAGISLERAATSLGLIAVVATAGLTAWAMARDGRGVADSALRLLCGVLMAALPAFAFWSVSGMDHALFAACVTAALGWALPEVVAGRVSARTALLLSAAMLARPEGALLALWVGGFAVARQPRGASAGSGVPRWRAVAAPMILPAATWAAMLVARYAYFGVLAPNTYYSKVTPDTADRLWRGAVYLHTALQAHVALLALAAGLGLLAWRRQALADARLAFLGGWLALWFAYVVASGGDHFPMYRFLLPALPALVIAIGLLSRGLIDPPTPVPRVAIAAAAIAAFGISGAASLALDGEGARLQPQLTASWSNVGRWIAGHTPADTLVATNVIGAIGFFGQRRVVDMLGLVDPVIGREGRVHAGAVPGHGRYHTDYVYARAPDLVVYPKSGRQLVAFEADPLSELWDFALHDFASDPRAAERYEHIAVPLPDGTWVEMWKKRTFEIAERFERRGSVPVLAPRKTAR